MDLNDLTAAQIARIDVVCELFETSIRRGTLLKSAVPAPQDKAAAAAVYDAEIERLVRVHCGEESPSTDPLPAEVLRHELVAVRRELVDMADPPADHRPFAIVRPAGDHRDPPGVRRADVDVAAGVDATSRTLGPPAAGAPAPGDDSAAGTASPGTADPLQASLSGRMIGPYQIGRMIGKGGMGAVFIAHDVRLGRRVAIKFLIPRPRDNPAKTRELSERFEREAKAVAALTHPNIVELFDVGTVNLDDSAGSGAGSGAASPLGRTPYAVMERLGGETLEDVLRCGKLSGEHVRQVGSQIADALAAAHAGGVIHRDLKPQNVMLKWRPETEGERGIPPDAPESGAGIAAAFQNSVADGKSIDDLDRVTVKLFDFGLSRIPHQLSGVRPGDSDTGESDTGDATGDEWQDVSGALGSDAGKHGDANSGASATLAGVIMGTPGYMAPEQARGKKVDHATDIFSLGAVLHEAFYGTAAFSGATVRDRYRANLEHVPATHPAIAATDPSLAELIARCLQSNPTDRPESAEVVAEQLRRGLAANRGGGISIDRRSFLESIVGGTVGAVGGGWIAARERLTLQRIRSIGFATFLDRSEIVPPIASMPKRSLTDTGQLLASTLANALSRLDTVTVRHYSPIRASTPEEFRRIAEVLEVDALVTGDFERVKRGSRAFLHVNVVIVSAGTGAQLWGAKYITEAGTDLLEQSKFAGNIAKAIGAKLTQPRQSVISENAESFACLEKGLAFADPDSIDGLETSLKCFQHASSINPEAAEPYAGLAVASLTLAAQSDDSSADALITDAQAAIDEAFALDPQTPAARTAESMLNWQRLENYREAFNYLQSAVMAQPNHWQVNHQFGMLCLTMGNDAEAIRYIRKASKLHPMSVVLKTDLVRGEWFVLGRRRAVVEAAVLADRFANSSLVNGLWIDLYESTGDYTKAAEVARRHLGDDVALGGREFSPADYFAWRGERLAELPYGPFGETMNRAVLQERMLARDANAKVAGASGARTRARPPEVRLARLRDRQPLMLVPLLARHPAFAALRRERQATEMLPGARSTW